MQLPLSPRAQQHGLVSDRDFWLRDLRLGAYHDLVRQIHDPAFRVDHLARRFPRRRHLVYLADRLGIAHQRSTDRLRADIAQAGPELLPYFAAAAFTMRKDPAAVIDAARHALPPPLVETARTDRACAYSDGVYDRLLLVLYLLDRHPEALIHVRCLHAWHRLGAASLAMEGTPPHRKTGFAAFLTRHNVEQAITTVPLPEGVRRVCFEMSIDRGQGQALLFLRRNLKRGHLWCDDGVEIQHGHDEELIVLHFIEEGRRVRISGRTSELPRRLAQGIASAWFATSVTYCDDLVPAHPASLRRLVDALLTGTVTDVRLAEVAIRNAPVIGAPLLIVRAPGPHCDVARSVADLEGRLGPLIERVADIEYLKVEFNRRIIEIDFPLVGDQPLVRFADGRLDRHAAERFRLFVEQAFGLPMHSMEAPCV